MQFCGDFFFLSLSLFRSPPPPSSRSYFILVYRSAGTTTHLDKEKCSPTPPHETRNVAPQLFKMIEKKISFLGLGMINGEPMNCLVSVHRRHI